MRRAEIGFAGGLDWDGAKRASARFSQVAFFLVSPGPLAMAVAVPVGREPSFCSAQHLNNGNTPSTLTTAKLLAAMGSQQNRYLGMAHQRGGPALGALAEHKSRFICSSPSAKGSPCRGEGGQATTQTLPLTTQRTPQLPPAAGN